MITVETTVHASLTKTWNSFTDPKHIVNWCFASPDWHAPRAENDIKTGGKFLTRMEAKDGSFGFDLEGVYSLVEFEKSIAYALPDGRKVEVNFDAIGPNETKVTESFDPESQNPEEMQKNGWQAILDNFNTYTEQLA